MKKALYASECGWKARQLFEQCLCKASAWAADSSGSMKLVCIARGLYALFV
jgi:hypothetical protein